MLINMTNGPISRISQEDPKPTYKQKAEQILEQQQIQVTGYYTILKKIKILKTVTEEILKKSHQRNNYYIIYINKYCNKITSDNIMKTLIM